jgi:uncharacterized damage-inducible protein DinB
MKTNITLKQILIEEAEQAYNVTEKLFRKVTDNELQWKPEAGKNWMNISQVMMHIVNVGCGKAIRAVIIGKWSVPKSVDADGKETKMYLLPAEKQPSIESVKKALEMLEEDRKLTLQSINDVEESRMVSNRFTAPWGGSEATLFQHIRLMITHLNQHKGQLFYYLKLMGKDVNTGDLWGM